jgi:hypothetical protein
MVSEVCIVLQGVYVEKLYVKLLTVTSINIFHLAAISTLKSPMLDHFIPSWKLWSINTLSRQLAWEATEYIHSARMDSVKAIKCVLALLFDSPSYIKFMWQNWF